MRGEKGEYRERNRRRRAFPSVPLLLEQGKTRKNDSYKEDSCERRISGPWIEKRSLKWYLACDSSSFLPTMALIMTPVILLITCVLSVSSTGLEDVEGMVRVCLTHCYILYP